MVRADRRYRERLRTIVAAAVYAAVALLIIAGIALGAQRIAPQSQKGRIAVISDTFTTAAYRHGAFYDYYCAHKVQTSSSNSSSISSISSSSNNINNKPDRFCQRHNVKCGQECLTVRVNDGPASRNATPQTLDALLKYVGNSNIDVITDGKVSTDPGILDSYSKVILLHNEYVTQTEYNAILHHKKVVYLYPNALYAEVKFDPTNNRITLIRGHGYPITSISNGFGWEHDNTNEEYNRDCNNWTFHHIGNGIQLNCYPEYDTADDTPILEELKFWKIVREY